MTSPRMTVGVASNERRMFEITIPSIGKIVCETMSARRWRSSTASNSAKP